MFTIALIVMALLIVSCVALTAGSPVVEKLRAYRKMARQGAFDAAGLTAIGSAKQYHAAHDIEIVAAGWATVGDDGSRRDDTPRARATQLP